ncbi:hypothetical protein ACOSP7_022184 [Xanthoceras sorbifolium]
MTRGMKKKQRDFKTHVLLSPDQNIPLEKRVEISYDSSKSTPDLRLVEWGTEAADPCVPSKEVVPAGQVQGMVVARPRGQSQTDTGRQQQQRLPWVSMGRLNIKKSSLGKRGKGIDFDASAEQPVQRGMFGSSVVASFAAYPSRVGVLVQLSMNTLSELRCFTRSSLLGPELTASLSCKIMLEFEDNDAERRVLRDELLKTKQGQSPQEGAGDEAKRIGYCIKREAGQSRAGTLGGGSSSETNREATIGLGQS